MPTIGGTKFPICKDTITALEAIKFVADHLKNEDDYSEVICGNFIEYFNNINFYYFNNNNFLLDCG